MKKKSLVRIIALLVFALFCTFFTVCVAAKVKMVSIPESEYIKLKSDVKSLKAKLAAKANYIDAKLVSSKYYFDGSEKATSNNEKTIIYNGSVYLPIKFISDSMNKEFTWDGKKSIVYVGKKPAGSFTYLDQTKTFSAYVDEILGRGLPTNFTSFETNIGEKYVRGLISDRGVYFEYEYLLNAKYKTFTGKIAPSSYWNTQEVNKKAAYINVYIDDEIAYLSGDISSNILKPIDFSVDVTNGAKIKITGMLDNCGLLDAKLIY